MTRSQRFQAASAECIGCILSAKPQDLKAESMTVLVRGFAGMGLTDMGSDAFDMGKEIAGEQTAFERQLPFNKPARPCPLCIFVTELASCIAVDVSGM